MRLTNDYLYDLIGKVNRIHWGKVAELEFILNEREEIAILDKSNFFHNGRRIPVEDELDIYIQSGTQVKFSCEFVQPGRESPYSWMVFSCSLLYPSPFARSIRITGIPARVSTLNDQDGTIAFMDERCNELEAYFSASVLRINGKEVDLTESLSKVLQVNERVFLDVIPCVPGENPVKAEYIAVKISKGENHGSLMPVPSPPLQANVGCSFIFREMHKLFHGDYTTYIRGRGKVARMLNNELGLIQGETAVDCVEPIVFHQKSSSFYESCLPGATKETNFKAGDAVSFVAAKTSFAGVMEWVAIQVADYDAEEYGPLPLCTDLYINRRTEEFLLFIST